MVPQRPVVLGYQQLSWFDESKDTNMSSSYTCVAVVVQEPEKLVMGGKPTTKLRLVDKAISKRHEDRFFNALLGGFDAETAGRLAKGDKILITGTLAINKYTSKKTGKEVLSDEMGFGTRILRVIQSPTFFGEGQGEKAEDRNAPPADVVPAGPGPLDDII